MTVLIFRTPAAIAAARHILLSPPLAYSPFVNWSRGADHRIVPLTVDVEDGAPFSTGEAECLIPLLESLSMMGPFFDLRSMLTLDEDTRQVAWQAIGIGAGCIRERSCRHERR